MSVPHGLGTQQTFTWLTQAEPHRGLQWLPQTRQKVELSFLPRGNSTSSVHPGWPRVSAAEGRWESSTQVSSGFSTKPDRLVISLPGPSKPRQRVDRSSALSSPLLTRLKPLWQLVLRNGFPQHITAQRSSISDLRMHREEDRVTVGTRERGSSRAGRCADRGLADSLSVRTHSLSLTTFQLCSCRVRAGKNCFKTTL